MWLHGTCYHLHFTGEESEFETHPGTQETGGNWGLKRSAPILDSNAFSQVPPRFNGSIQAQQTYFT